MLLPLLLVLLVRRHAHHARRPHELKDLSTSSHVTTMNSLAYLAPASSLACFFAPLSSVRAVEAAQSTGDLPALTFVSLEVMTAIWCTYGVLRDDWAVITPNVIGAVLAAYFLKVFDAFSPKTGPRAAELKRTYTAGIVVLTLLLLDVVFDDPARAVRVVGTSGAALSMIFAASPLTALPSVVRNRTPDAIPLSTSAMVLISNVLWTMYGLWVANDSSIWVPNLFGTAVSGVAVGVHAVFALNIVEKGGVRAASL